MSEQQEPATPDTVPPGTATAVADNMVVSFHYRLAEVLPDGTHTDWMEASHGAQPLLYLHGFHNVVVGLEKAMAGKQVGDAITITLKPEEAYGARRPNAVQRVPLKHLQLQGKKKPGPGVVAVVQTNQGARNVVIVKAGKFNADVDFNHPLSGRTLHYEIQVVSVRAATADELAHGHAHGTGGHHH